ncbi:MAG: Uma2 family endonuclease [Candidatus Competibacteraceae bacterium]|nr:MAG: Uma2 family endonuclease [Candidatus Competibacteraceae bacterium]
MTTTALSTPATDSRRGLSPASRQPIVYPESDGRPMADNTRQFDCIVMIQGGLAALFADRPDVFVAGDLLWYPVEGQPHIRAAPDAMVVFGRPPGHRGSYIQHEEDYIAPQVVFEVLSPGNTPAEMRKKRDFYDRYGVEEYYEYDPDRGTLKGWLRREGRLEPIASMEGWVSPLLGIRFGLEGTDLALHHPDGQRFETFVEQARRAEAERQRAEAERQRAEAERQRAERLAERLRQLGVDPDSL